MTRRLLNLLTAVSLLLCVAVCVLWVRSYWVFSRARPALVVVGRKRRSRRASRTAGLPGGVPPPPRPEGVAGLVPMPATSPPQAVARSVAAGTRPGHAPGGGL